MTDDSTTPGSASWLEQTSGWLTPAERRALLAPLIRDHARNLIGRLALAAGLHAGRHATVAPARLVPPDTDLTRAAEDRARGILPVALLNHSYRTYTFGRALAELEGINVDSDLLFAAAMLHDVGLVHPTGDADFTLVGSRLARDVAEHVGLSTAATRTLRTAITMHHSPGVRLSVGPVAYLLSAGAAVDVVGLRAWDLPNDTLTAALRAHPRADFKTAFTAAFRREAARVPHGRARFLHRYGAFAAAIRFAPFDE